jgi:hypothetical protein
VTQGLGGGLAAEEKHTLKKQPDAILIKEN